MAEATGRVRPRIWPSRSRPRPDVALGERADDEAGVGGEADRDLEADDPLVEHVLAHHLEAVGLDHRGEAARAAVGGELEQVPDAVFLGRHHVRHVEAVVEAEVGASRPAGGRRP